MKIMRAGMENENTKMRRIISVYIQSSDLNDPAWEVMEEDDMGQCRLSHVNCSYRIYVYFLCLIGTETWTKKPLWVVGYLKLCLIS